MKNPTPFLLCLLFFISINANGQARRTIGLTAGANLSRIYTSNSEVPSPGGTVDINDDLSWQAGAQIGIVATPLVFNEQLSLSTALIFVQRGTTTKVFNILSGEEQEGLIRLQYLSLPIMARVYPVNRFFLEAGPQLAYLLDARSKLRKGDDEDIDFKPFVDSDFDWGLSVGTGFEVHPRLSLLLQYYHGLGKVRSIAFTDQNGEPVNENNAPAWYNRSLQLGLVVHLL